MSPITSMTLPQFFISTGFLLLTLVRLSASETITVRLPDGALQPRTASVGDGSTAVVFLQGNPQASEVKIATLSSAGTLDTVTTINTPTTQAVGMGTVRGPSLALGREGVRHVLWHGKNGSASSGKGSALYFARVDVSGKASAPLDMLGTTTALDGGASITANTQGDVWIVWHALPAGKEGESERRIFVKHSSDNGITFSEPWPIKGEDMGVCGCCGLATTTDTTGALYVLYRTAERTSQRGARLLSLPPKATSNSMPALLKKDRWDLAACPMTTAAWLPTSKGANAIWITEFKINYAGQGLEGINLSPTTSKAMQNHPRVARNTAGEMLLLWTEGSMWGKGGELVTQNLSANSKPLSTPQKQPLPTWSYGACAALPDGRFAVIY